MESTRDRLDEYLARYYDIGDPYSDGCFLYDVAGAVEDGIETGDAFAAKVDGLLKETDGNEDGIPLLAVRLEALLEEEGVR
jgi:hypothetical protein